MATFETAIEQVLAHEGILSNDPADPGGITKWGISLRWLQSQGQLGDTDMDGKVDADDVRKLTRVQAIALYRARFWRPEYEKFPQGVGEKVFDTAVNMGPSPATLLLQVSLNQLGIPVTIDGVLGQQTAAATMSAPADALLREYRAAQSYRYAQLAISNPAMRVFLRGWMRRAAA